VDLFQSGGRGSQALTFWLPASRRPSGRRRERRRAPGARGRLREAVGRGQGRARQRALLARLS